MIGEKTTMDDMLEGATKMKIGTSEGHEQLQDRKQR
jgi:hypothetical protein